MRAHISIAKTDAEMGIVWGYASVADLVDLQGDVVPESVMAQAAYKFVEDYYAGQTEIKVNHEHRADAVLVESTFHWLGDRLAWFVGVKLLSDELRQAARDGDISGFSIGGRADVVEVEDEDPDQPEA